MWNGKTVSVAFPAYNEQESIRAAIEDFFSSGYVDSVLVVNNNSRDGTLDEIKKTKAVVVNEEKQGYGWAVRRCLKEAPGDYVILAEPDGTFSGKDVLKLLAYCDDFDMVIGTRTAKDLIWSGANMGLFLRWGNWAVAKMLEALFSGPSLTDVGCTMRLIKRECLDRIQGQFTVEASHFLPEMTTLAILNGLRIVEIPLNYKERIGTSKITGTMAKAVNVGTSMIFLILGYRLRSWFTGKYENRH